MQKVFVVLAALCSQAIGDIYMHNPRGSNDRLNEASAQRKNANRLFDSQNNNRGGYNVGDATDVAAGADEGKQYRMKYFQSGPTTGKTQLTIEWTNQHGCGGNEDDNPQKLNCKLVLQYMCQDDVDEPTGGPDTIRNGVSTATQAYTKPSRTETEAKVAARKAANVQQNKGLHETWNWYEQCVVRNRNNGLFLADQKLKGQSAIFTRQNANGNRRGYECPEERDYYPYWHPTPWTDIAVLAENASLCDSYTAQSFNVQPYGLCIEKYDSGNRKDSKFNTPASCAEGGGVWTELHNYLEKASIDNEAACTASINRIWAIPYDSVDGSTKECLVKLSKPACQEAPWSRSNHLGNGIGGEPNTVQWTIPHFPSLKEKRCILRMRYNISTDDYDPFNTDSSSNNQPGKPSPVTNNPFVDIGVGRTPLRLAINTAQFGRVFQDRTHAFLLRPRPAELQNERILNLNVRGKRGNIVQVYPSVEYDFVPTNLELTESDLVHIQWEGSNTHKNGRPGGDGQTGEAGEGKSGSDRHNIAQMADRNENYPVPFEKSTMWDNAEVKWIYHGLTSISKKSLAINMASSGYYRCISATECPNPDFADFLVETKEKMQNQLNNAPASYEGAVLKFKKGTYHYMCTRNNNFTNRSQKATIIVQ
ncbi:hypothetical protein SNE40_014828 [Patella caerulea]|uniref:Protein DD3-3 n=1 Tax=Patella caerulea TaxID=87958 RepID=A0AAN8JFG6_PATCE